MFHCSIFLPIYALPMLTAFNADNFVHIPNSKLLSLFWTLFQTPEPPPLSSSELKMDI